MACQIGRALAEIGLAPQEVRRFVLNKLVHADEAGIALQWPDGTLMEITVEFVEEVFDGRSQVERPVSVDWSDEIIASDRAIRDLIKRAVAGQVRTVPDRRWAGRFRLILMALAVPSFDVDVRD
ncbi:MAG: hypothetical protein AAF311_10420 [Pseudomonadota bacterium]